MSFTGIAVIILAAWVFLVNVTEVSSTVGWIMGAAAVILAALDQAALGGPRKVGN